MEQAKLWALAKMADNFDVKLPAHKIACVLKKVGGGAPGEGTVQQWQELFRSDDDWHPGKTYAEGEARGPKPQFTAQKKNAVASVAMALKRGGSEPTVSDVRQRCPTATHNPNTDQSFTDKYILQVFRTQCFDDGAD